MNHPSYAFRFGHLYGPLNSMYTWWPGTNLWYPKHSSTFPPQTERGFWILRVFFPVKSSKTFISAKSLYKGWFPRYDRCWLFTASENRKEHLSAFPCEPVPELPRKKADRSKPLFYRWCFKKLWRFGMKMPQNDCGWERAGTLPQRSIPMPYPCHLFSPPVNHCNIPGHLFSPRSTLKISNSSKTA